MRRPEPFYWTARKGWYVTLQGRQIKLGPAPTKTKTPPPDVVKEYHRVMLVGGRPEKKERDALTVPEGVEAFIEDKAGARPKTIKAYLFYLQPFALKFRTRQLATVKPAEVLAFVNGQKGWGDTTSHNAVQAIKGLFKWAKAVELIDSNPLAVMKNPFHVQAREKGISLEEFRTLIDACPDEEFRSVLRFLRDTGCRPGDVCVLSSRHLHPSKPVATLRPDEHKTGGRTGKPKVIIMTGAIHEEVKALAKAHTDGPLLRNTEGEAWNPDAILKRMKKLGRKVGLPHIFPYASRHGFMTRLVESGTPLAIAAKIAGHASVSTIQESYLHPDLDKMTDAVNGIAGTPPALAETPEAKIARLEAELAQLRGKVSSSPEGA